MGTKADLQAWHDKNAVGFMQKEAQAQFYQLPKQLQNYIVTKSTPEGTFVDGAALREKLNKTLDQKNKEIEDATNDRDKASAIEVRDKFLQNIVTWEAYVNGVGSAYVK